MKPWIGIDLDGTLAYYEEWQGIENIGEPIPKMVKKVKDFLDVGEQVKIFTARVSRDQDGYTIEQIASLIQDWSEKHLGVRLEVTCKKDFGMIRLYDDRCVQIVSNSGISLDEWREERRQDNILRNQQARYQG